MKATNHGATPAAISHALIRILVKFATTATVTFVNTAASAQIIIANSSWPLSTIPGKRQVRSWLRTACISCPPSAL